MTEQQRYLIEVAMMTALKRPEIRKIGTGIRGYWKSPTGRIIKSYDIAQSLINAKGDVVEAVIDYVNRFPLEKGHVEELTPENDRLIGIAGMTIADREELKRNRPLSEVVYANEETGEELHLATLQEAVAACGGDTVAGVALYHNAAGQPFLTADTEIAPGKPKH